jgi:hypothetical protein
MTVCERRVNLLVYSLSLHRYSYVGFILDFTSSIHNKQTMIHNIHNKLDLKTIYSSGFLDL